MANTLIAREYKLLLNAGKFSGKPSLEAAQRFLREQIAPLAPDVGGAFKDPPEQRTICFRDTADRLLDRHDYILREREPAGETSEITLKFRVPDPFVAADIEQSAVEGGEISFEEDIAPLEVPDFDRNKVVVANPPSMRSRFSLSTKYENTADKAMTTLADAFELFPNLRANLAVAGATGFDETTPLKRGPQINEYVYKGAKIKFPGGVDGKLSLTLWYFPESDTEPRIAEISFKCKFGGETGDPQVAKSMPGEAARSALAFFKAAQLGLASEWLNLDEASKTKLALPE
jgi:hypothetical protein